MPSVSGDEILKLLFEIVATPTLTAFVLNFMLSRRQEALKFDFARQLEATKHELSKVSTLYERRADGIAQLWPAARKAEDMLARLLSPLVQGGEDKLEQLNTAISAHHDLVTTWDSIAVFLPELEALMEALLKSFRCAIDEYRFSQTSSFDVESKARSFEKAQKALESLGPMRQAIRVEAAGLLGLADVDASARLDTTRAVLAPSTDAQPRLGPGPGTKAGPA